MCEISNKLLSLLSVLMDTTIFAGKFVLPKKESSRVAVDKSDNCPTSQTKETADAPLQQANGKRKNKHPQQREQLLQKYEQIQQEQQHNTHKKMTRGQKIRHQQVASVRNGFKQVFQFIITWNAWVTASLPPIALVTSVM